MKEKVIPGDIEKFFILRKRVLKKTARNTETTEFGLLKKKLKKRLMNWETNRIFEFEIGKYNE